MLDLTVDRVAYDASGQRAVVLLKHAATERFLPILVGPLEGAAIAMAIEGFDPPRPQTHDLLKLILDRLGAKVSGVLIDDVRDETFFAQITLTLGSETIEVDSRPSDAIALALRAKAPIRALGRVLDVAGVTVDPGQVH
jgi:bifunctional DNase/RNase